MTECSKSMNLPMGDFPHLSKAPIIEALIDLRINAIQEWDPDSFRDFIAKELPDYPIVQPQKMIQTEIKAKPNAAPEQVINDLGLIGFVFRSEDNLHVAQFKRDRFTFSRLKPYIDWEHLVREAHRLWDIYQRYTQAQTVTRIGVRYINQIDAPTTGDISSYLVNAPKIPSECEWIFNAFMHRDVFEIPNTPYNVILNTSMPFRNNQGGFTVDIDVFAQSSFESNTIWEKHLSQMRNLKNKMFFETIHETIWEGMK